MKLIRTAHLSILQQTQIRTLLEECSHYDACPFSFPDTDVRQYYLCLAPDGSLRSVLAACQTPGYEDELECAAYTAPAMRKRRYFTALLEQCVLDFAETDLVFPVDHRSQTGLGAMAALQAECVSTQCRMDYHFGGCQKALADGLSGHGAPNARSGEPSDQPLPPTPSLSLETADNQLWQLNNGRVPVASCKTALSGTGACLYEVETLPTYQNQGFATAMLAMLLPRLNKLGTNHVWLHVSGSNVAAVALYKKTGFRITETLSYYLY